MLCECLDRTMWNSDKEISKYVDMLSLLIVTDHNISLEKSTLAVNVIKQIRGLETENNQKQLTQKIEFSNRFNRLVTIFDPTFSVRQSEFHFAKDQLLKILYSEGPRRISLSPVVSVTPYLFPLYPVHSFLIWFKRCSPCFEPSQRVILCIVLHKAITQKLLNRLNIIARCLLQQLEYFKMYQVKSAASTFFIYLFNDDGQQAGAWICPSSRNVERANTQRTVNNRLQTYDEHSIKFFNKEANWLPTDNYWRKTELLQKKSW